VITVDAISFPSIRPGEVYWCAFGDGPAPALVRRRTAGWVFVSKLGRRGRWLAAEIRVPHRSLCGSFGAAAVEYQLKLKIRQQTRDAMRYWHGRLLAMAELRAEAEMRAKVPPRPGKPARGVAR
jgi:hypothetical protein